ncbi:ferredoxin--NADP(+) reductase [Pseudomonas putida]|nr:ferredoxin--NADP(+) reductase [Pseudomonas putida]
MSAIFDVRVADIRILTPVIREYQLQATSGDLPAFSAGSHIQLLLPGGQRNAYSLIGDPIHSDCYRIAVRQQERSRGGSSYIHQSLEVGAALKITSPANLFALNRHAGEHILVAAGIGITPFLAYSKELLRAGQAFELHYAYRQGYSDAYLENLRGELGERLHEYPSGKRRLDVKTLLQHRSLSTHIYACGPQHLVADLKEGARQSGWSPNRVHWEAFASAEPGQAFEVVLARSNLQLHVTSNESLLEALERSGVKLPNLCRGGVCGLCQTRWLQGDVEHRDMFLTSEERESYLMPCVSRGCGSPIVLDI